VSFLNRVRACNNCRPGRWVAFLVGSYVVGRILTIHLPRLRHWPEIFELEAHDERLCSGGAMRVQVGSGPNGVPWEVRAAERNNHPILLVSGAGFCVAASVT